jgi:hypothetical protein
MARAAKAFSAISMGAAFVLTTGEAGAQSSRASAEEGFSPLNGTPIGFNDEGDLIVLMADSSETIIPRGEYGLIGDQIMVSDMIEGVEVAQNGYIPPTSGAPMYGSYGPTGMGFAPWLIPLGLVAVGVIAYIYFSRSVNEAPKFAVTSYAVNYDENDTSTVLTAAATDGEADTVSYSISGTDSQFFSIDSTSGAITFKESPNYDAPGDAGFDNQYNFTVTASDDHGEASSVPVTVTVQNESDIVNNGTGTVNGTAGNDDIKATAKVTAASNLNDGNDYLNIDQGLGAFKVDMGAGNDKVLITTTLLDSTATIDLGSGNNQLQLNFDITNDITVELGSGTSVIDINVKQNDANAAGKELTIQGFTSDDLIDVDDWKAFAVDPDNSTYTSVANAKLGVADGEYAYYYDSVSGDTTVLFNDGGDIFEIILDDYNSFSANNLIL